MFTNISEFKAIYQRKIAEKYGRSLAESHVMERYDILGEMIREHASLHLKEEKDLIANQGQKQMYYFSMEFLLGRMLTNNLMNLGIYDLVKTGLAELNIDLNELEALESDPGLGNGGLGRLAACFLDSLASLSYPGNGVSLRYEYGLFQQKIVDGYQVEVPDQWLRLGNVWEVRKPKHAVDVPFWGQVEITFDEKGKSRFRHLGAEYVKAVPCDLPIVGHETKMTNTLRLWTAEPSDNLPVTKDFQTYLTELREITQNVYPNDSNEHGRYLRLKQQYFFVSAGLQALVKAHLRVYPSLDNFAEKMVIQLNDTHPVLAIPELMRLLVDEHHYSWKVAWAITTQTFAYTNHTILAEALEKWPVEYVARLLPRIFMIIEEINRRHLSHMAERYTSDQEIYQTAIIKDGLVHMAHLAIIGSFSVNGVAALHSRLLMEDIFHPFYVLNPEKFHNKTNGVTHRRWLVYSNPELTKLISDYIGPNFIHDFSQIRNLLPYSRERAVQQRFLAVKQARKEILSAYVAKHLGLNLDTSAIFDTIAKRFHAYKRQLLKVFHIIYLMQELKTNPAFTMHPQVFFFAGKAAPNYTFAKEVIKLINVLSGIIEKDAHLKRYLRVVFIPNYSVSIAEILINASDVSEQISTAGKEASGTSNMKFMMNGAITVGTYDGANIEIDQALGSEHDIIFGLRVDEIKAQRFNGYNAKKIMLENATLQRVVQALIDGSLHPNLAEFKLIYDELLLKNDEFMVFADFDAYLKAQATVQRLYHDQMAWAESCLVNIASSGRFSSDRTIAEYATEIWLLEPLREK